MKFTEIVIASHNKGKLEEISALLKPLQIKVHSAADLGIPEPEETGESFMENAQLKAEHAAKHARIAALADDSGLCVDALGGAPGVFSARWSGENKDFSIAMKRVEQELRDARIEPEGAPAHFICNMCFYTTDGIVHSFEGKAQGNLSFPPRGNGGFGYDPIFIPEGFSKTHAEMDFSEKEKISARTKAFNGFLSHLGENI